MSIFDRIMESISTWFFGLPMLAQWVIGAIGILIVIRTIIYFSERRGKRKAIRILRKELKKIKLENPYIYFRELPNDYGIGVTSLLADFTIDYKKDALAAILDLVAKKHVKLISAGKKFLFEATDKDQSNLTANEQYLLWSIINKDSTEEFSYKKWKELCLQDATRLGLIEERVFKKKSPKVGPGFIILYFIIFIIVTAFIYIGFFYGDGQLRVSGLVFSIAGGLAASAAFYPIIGIVYSLHLGLFRMPKSIGYNETLEQTPIRTDLGEAEFHKWLAFYKFMDDFGAFAEKHVEEIVLWEFYLSHAQLFNLTDKIMKTGYKQILHNSVFDISDYAKVDRYITLSLKLY